MSQKIKVLYIAGTSRCGSTILCNMLGQVKGFTNVGEVGYLWDRGLLENWSCSCGSRFKDCHFWKTVLKDVFGDIESIDAERILNFSERGRYDNGEKKLRFRHLLFRSQEKLICKVNEIKEYVELIDKLYTSLHKTTECRVIVDSSKRPEYGFILKNAPNLQLYVLHLIRDPRAVVYSQVKRTKLLKDAPPDKRYMVRKGKGVWPILLTMRDWIIENILIEKLIKHDAYKYKLLRYEDFALNPTETFKEILKFVNEDESDLSFLNNDQVQLKKNHDFSGNPNRFKTGTVVIKKDSEWENKIGLINKIIISILCSFGLIKYQYFNFTKLNFRN